MEIDLTLYLAVAAFLYVLGIYCMVTKRNLIKLTIGIEILLSAANLNLMALGASRFPALGYVDPLVQSLVILSIIIGGAVAAIALSLVISVYRHYGTLDVRKIRKLKW